MTRYIPGQQYLATGPLDLAGVMHNAGQPVDLDGLVPSRFTRDFLVRTRKVVRADGLGADPDASTEIPGPATGEAAELGAATSEAADGEPDAGTEAGSPFPVSVTGKRPNGKRR